MLEHEANEHLKVQLTAMESCLFLPDYLLEEAFSDSGHMQADQAEEFKPAVMYMEQILRIFPREYTARLRMIPAFEETLMRYQEQASGGKAKE